MPESGPEGPSRPEAELAEALRESEQRFALMIDSVRDYAIFMLDPSGRIQTWNAGAEHMTGYNAREALGQHISLLYTPEDRRAGAPQRELEQAAQWGRDEREGVRRRKDGSHYWAHLVTTAVRDESGELQGFARVNRDVSEQRRAEEARRESEERLRAIVDTAVDAIITIDEAGRIQSINPAAEQMFGYEPEEVLGQNVRLLMPEPYRSEHDDYLRNYLQTGEAKIIGIGREVVAQRKDGSIFPVDLAVSEVRLGQRRMFTGMIRDITDRHRLQAELLEITAAERRRIGQDLHDGLCQQLTGAGFSLELIRSQLQSSADDQGETPQERSAKLQRLAESVEDVAGLLSRANSEARAVARGLNPVTLEKRGLGAALDELAGNLARAYGARIEVQCTLPESQTTGSVAHHIYRVVQEAANNALRHGQASHVWITCQEGASVVRVEDDGTGFDLSAARRDRKELTAGGMGLHILEYRARMIGGRLDVRPRSPTGTIIEVTRLARAQSGGRPAE